MEIVYAGAGSVGERCQAVLERLNIEWWTFDAEKVPSTADLLLSVHWPSKFRLEYLANFKAALNLHNSYLPWNRGAHACSWAIADNTPHGATLHWMDANFDTGDIFLQRGLAILDGETADELYRRTADLEVELFEEGIKRFMSGERTRVKQVGKGSWHTKRDFQRLVRAVTTSDCKVEHVHKEPLSKNVSYESS